WKTAGDSLLGALLLAPKDAQKILIVGAGTVGASLIEAFTAGFPGAQFTVWNRTRAGADALAAQTGAAVADDLETAVRAADIIVTGTMTTDPIIKGDWLRPGQHLNMIGAYRPDMREADDTALLKSSVYVDSFDTTLDHIGELKIPLTQGVIERDHVLADFYTLDQFQRADGDTTIFKNGGGAHMDLMTARYVLDAVD
ncbi:MAG: NAD(P)-binding domain-containing protein, partial [Pseudomonadota bacterium]